ncbi:hypothetical protein PR048_017797 [Dryococelus australis]|uniref:Uncharacterized protein n=1 Tax=Dryococelus australis TaxID=614101 RepID=A0ABQ9HAT4_9NEOP|nr:hypothetical protein PR048_017797 [Dryococelus australis]
MSLSKYVYKKASGGISHVGNKTAADREKEFPGVLHNDSGKLFCFVCMKACISVNIPLIKLDNREFCAFLNKHVVNGGSVPSHLQLRKEYLPGLHDEC